MTPFLADAIFWVAVVACAIAQVGILRATAAARVAARTATAAPAHRPATRIEEALWAALPVIALAGALFLTWRTLHPAVAAVPTAAVGHAA